MKSRMVTDFQGQLIGLDGFRLGYPNDRSVAHLVGGATVVMESCDFS